MTRRWVRYETPVMVCVDINDDTEQAEITNVVLITSEQDILLARDHRGHFLVYDERGEPLNHDVAGGGDQAAAQAIRTAEDRDAWPGNEDWDEGPDPVRYPEFYADADADADQEGEHQESDLEPLDLNERAAP